MLPAAFVPAYKVVVAAVAAPRRRGFGLVDMLRLIQKLEYRQREEERCGDHRNANSSQQRNSGHVHRDLLIPLPLHKPLALLVHPRALP